MARQRLCGFLRDLEMQDLNGVRLRNFVANCVALVTRSSKLASSHASVDHNNVSIPGVVSARVILLYTGSRFFHLVRA